MFIQTAKALEISSSRELGHIILNLNFLLISNGKPGQVSIYDRETGGYTIAASALSEEEQFQLCLSLKATMLLSWKSATAFNKCICSCLDIT